MHNITVTEPWTGDVAVLSGGLLATVESVNPSSDQVRLHTNGATLLIQTSGAMYQRLEHSTHYASPFLANPFPVERDGDINGPVGTMPTVTAGVLEEIVHEISHLGSAPIEARWRDDELVIALKDSETGVVGDNGWQDGWQLEPVKGSDGDLYPLLLGRWLKLVDASQTPRRGDDPDLTTVECWRNTDGFAYTSVPTTDQPADDAERARTILSAAYAGGNRVEVKDVAAAAAGAKTIYALVV